MQKKYKGILLFTKVFKDNDLFIKFLSNSDELVSGIVYGGLSKNKRNILQIGFYLNFNVTTKSNRPNTINAELSEPYISNIIDDKYKLSCLICISSLINLSILEGQNIKNIFQVVDTFIQLMINDKKWFNSFSIFLFKFLQIIGYEINYNEQSLKKYIDLESLKFQNFKTNHSIDFPYDLLNKKETQINRQSVIQLFTIFEAVFIKYHLSNFNLQLPNQYNIFKKLILDRLNNE